MKNLLFVFFLFSAGAFAQSASLMPWSFPQFLDANGHPLAGGKVCTYFAGTSSPLGTYTDSSGTVPNTNPVILNAGGYAPIWMTPAQYKVTVMTAGTDNTCSTGTVVYSQDNITPASTSGGGGGSPFTTNIISFGGVCDGVHNDHDAFVAAEASIYVNVEIPTNSLCIVTPQITLTKYYSGGRVSNGGFNQARNDININTLPSLGPQWTVASGAVTSITVAAGVATIHMTVNPNSPSVVAINGSEVAQALNTAGVAVTSSTSSTIVFSTSAANGTYTDAGIIVDDRTNVGFQGDNSRTVEVTHSTIAASVNRQAINNQYYNYTMNPHWTEFDMNSGYSGSSAIMSSPSSIGATAIVLNSTADFAAGKLIQIDTGGASPETRKVTSVVGSTLNLDLALTAAHATGSFCGLGGRTASAAYYTETNIGALGGGDTYGFWANMACGSVAHAGQIHPFINATCGIFGGASSATADRMYLQSTETQIDDNGFDVFAVGDVRSFVRFNNTAANYQEWVGEFWQSTGTKAVDAGLVLAGNFNIGVDLSRMIMSATNDAIQMPANGRVYFDVGYAADGSNTGTPIYGNVINTQTYMFYDVAASTYKFFQGGTDAMAISSAAAIFAGGISVGKGYKATPVAFSTLGTCNTGMEGASASIVDGNSATWGAAVAGGGANHVYAYCDGTGWTVMGK